MRTTDENNNTFDKVFTVLVTPRQPIVITVDNTGDTHQTGHTTLRDAIAIANLDYVGDTIFPKRTFWHDHTDPAANLPSLRP